MLTTLAFATALLGSRQAPADKWDIKSGLAPKSNASQDLNISVNAGAQSHTATMKFKTAIKDQDGTKPLQATISWNDVQLDDGQAIPDASWDVTLDPHGLVLDSTADDGADVVRKMLTPFMFAYPDAAVGVGDTWSVTVKGGSDKDDQSITEDMKVDSMDKVGDADVIKVVEKLSQKGDDALSGTGTWWVNKTGKILKFHMEAANWEVPLVPGQLMSFTADGSASK